MMSKTRGKKAWLIMEDDFKRISRLSKHLRQERKQKLEEEKNQTGDGLIWKDLPTTREKINETSVDQIKTQELSVDDISSIKLHVTGQSQALYAFNLYRAILKLEEDKWFNGIPFPNGITRELLMRLKRRILKQYGDKIARAAFPNYKRDDMTRQTASSVVRQSTVQLGPVVRKPISVNPRLNSPNPQNKFTLRLNSVAQSLINTIQGIN